MHIPSTPMYYTLLLLRLLLCCLLRQEAGEEEEKREENSAPLEYRFDLYLIWLTQPAPPSIPQPQPHIRLAPGSWTWAVRCVDDLHTHYHITTTIIMTMIISLRTAVSIYIFNFEKETLQWGGMAMGMFSSVPPCTDCTLSEWASECCIMKILYLSKWAGEGKERKGKEKGIWVFLCFVSFINIWRRRLFVSFSSLSSLSSLFVNSACVWVKSSD